MFKTDTSPIREFLMLNDTIVADRGKKILIECMTAGITKRFGTPAPLMNVKFGTWCVALALTTYA